MAEEEEKLSKKEQKKLEKEEKKKAKQLAKEQGDENGDEEETTGGNALVVIVAILIVIVWLVIFALLIKMDVGGFGSTVLYPYLKDIPYVNKILPESEDYAEEDEAYRFDTVDDAVVRIKELEAELAEAKNLSGADASYIAELEAEARELEQFKADQAQFEKTKEKFYEEVVFSDVAPDINKYKEYYESIDSQNAAAIYKEVIAQLQKQEDLDDYVKAYSSMKPAQAASIFNTMTNDLKLVAKILDAMDAESRGKILGAMDTDIAAQVTELMEP